MTAKAKTIEATTVAGEQASAAGKGFETTVAGLKDGMA
jgi:hypothetical protein